MTKQTHEADKQRVIALLYDNRSISVVHQELARVQEAEDNLVKDLHEYTNSKAITRVCSTGETVRVGAAHYLEFIVLENFIELEDYDGDRRATDEEINYWVDMLKEALEEFKLYVL